MSLDPNQPADDGYRVHVFGETDAVGPDDVLALWAREGVVRDEEAMRRIHEVVVVGTAPDGSLAGVCTAYLQRHRQLGVDLWYYRTFVGSDHRMGTLARRLGLRGFALLEERFVSGQDRRGIGLGIELQHQGMSQHFTRMSLRPENPRFVFLGQNARGDRVFVHYFPGATVPPPG